MNAADKKGETPLFAATKKSHEFVVQLLLQHGARPDLPAGELGTPRELARSMGLTWMEPKAAPQRRHSASDLLLPGRSGSNTGSGRIPARFRGRYG